MPMNSIKSFILVFLGFCLAPHLAISQTKINLVGGLGLPEFMNIGIEAQTEKMSYSARFGLFPYEGEYIYSYSAEVAYLYNKRIHVNKEIHTYLKTVFSYTIEETKTANYNDSFLSIRIGSKHNFNNGFGFFFDIGMAFILYSEDRSQTNFFDIDPKAIPSGSFGIFKTL